MNDYHRTNHRINDTYFYVSCSAAKFHKYRIFLITLLDNLIFVLQNHALCCKWCRNIQKLNLGNHNCSGRMCRKSTANACHLCCVCAGCNYGRLLRNHRDNIIFAVDLEVDCHTKRKCKTSDYILDHMIRLVHIQTVRILQHFLVFFCQICKLCNFFHSVLN